MLHDWQVKGFCLSYIAAFMNTRSVRNLLRLLLESPEKIYPEFKQKTQGKETWDLGLGRL